MILPTYERRFYLNLHLNNIEEQNEARTKQQSSGPRGTKRVSGDTLKYQMKNNLIPNL